MINKTFYSIFKKGSKTYFYSSLFFPTNIRMEVFQLYGFVRKADNFVDDIPQDKQGFYRFKHKYERAINGEVTGDVVIDTFAKLANKNNFDKKWIDAFFTSMEMDLVKTNYVTIDDTLRYIYGSAEVIGLMMANTMNLPKESHYYAKYLGRAMQYINFIRDIPEDLDLGRVYFPKSDLEEFGLEKLDYNYTKNHKERFIQYIHKQIDRYCEWQSIAEEGYKYIPNRYLISVKTASELYHWTAEQIYKNPFVVYEWKVKPFLTKILLTTIANIIDPSKSKPKKLFYCPLKKTTPDYAKF